METKNFKIKVLPGGPLLIEGGAWLIDRHGLETEKKETFALCRCGQSKNKPYCDGAHKNVQFDIQHEKGNL